MARVRLRAVSKAFDGRAVLAEIDLSIASGEVVALVGPSGSGKSTLLNLIAGIEPVDGGQVQIGDTFLERLDDPGRTRFRRRHIGLIYQFFNLIPTLTVAENLRLPLQLNGLPQGDRVAELLDTLGLAGRQRAWPEQLSGGEQQRVAIARALIHRPALLLADEPTGSLDNATAETVMALLLEQVRQRQQSLLLVTHNTALCAQADRSYRLHQGRLEPFDQPAASDRCPGC